MSSMKFVAAAVAVLLSTSAYALDDNVLIERGAKCHAVAISQTKLNRGIASFLNATKSLAIDDATAENYESLSKGVGEYADHLRVRVSQYDLMARDLTGAHYPAYQQVVVTDINNRLSGIVTGLFSARSDASTVEALMKEHDACEHFLREVVEEAYRTSLFLPPLSSVAPAN